MVQGNSTGPRVSQAKGDRHVSDYYNANNKRKSACKPEICYENRKEWKNRKAYK